MEWRLTEHFFKAMFDFGFLSELGADSFKRLLIGSVGGFIAFGLLLTRVYVGKYAALLRAGSPEQYRSAILGDDMMIIGLPMLLVAFITLLVSDALFPRNRAMRATGRGPRMRKSRSSARNWRHCCCSPACSRWRLTCRLLRWCC